MNKFTFSYQTTRSEEDSIFDDVEYPSSVNISHNVTFSDDCRWPEIVREVGKFLASVGYVGASEQLSDFADYKNEELQYFVENLDKTEQDDENISNPGLSD